MRNFSLTIFLILALSSCISRLEKHGYMFDFSDQDMLQEGVISKERVLKIMGSPTIISELDKDEAWIYYFENVQHFLFFKPTITERDVLVLHFNEAGTLKELNRVNLSNQNEGIKFSANYTAVDDHKTSFLNSFFSNVGQVKPQ